MMRGVICKVALSYGSTWGRIQPTGDSRQIFFRPDSLLEPWAFNESILGRPVEFEEEQDRANGTHAVRIRADSDELAAATLREERSSREA